MYLSTLLLMSIRAVGSTISVRGMLPTLTLMPLLPWVVCSLVLLHSLLLLVWLQLQLLLPVVRRLRSPLLQLLMPLQVRVALTICHSKRCKPMKIRKSHFSILKNATFFRLYTYFLGLYTSLLLASKNWRDARKNNVTPSAFSIATIQKVAT